MKSHTAGLKKEMSNTPARSMIKIQELRRASAKSLAEINALLPQLSKTPKPLSLKLLDSIVRDKNIRLVVAKEGTQIVGMATLILMIAPNGKRAKVEDVVVDEKYRGKGIGEKISKKLVAIAKSKKVRRIELTTGQRRIAAHRLYEKIGFKKKDSDVYRITF